MVSKAQQLRKQQQLLRTPGMKSGTSELRLQQEALTSGVPLSVLKQRRKEEQLRKKAEKVLVDIRSGKIKSFSQIPSDVQPLLNRQEVTGFFEARRQQEKRDRERQAFETLDKQVQRNFRDNPGFVSSSRARRVREAFERAGLSGAEGEKLFRKQARSGSLILRDEEGEFVGGVDIRTGKISRGTVIDAEGKRVGAGSKVNLGQFSFDLGKRKRVKITEVEPTVLDLNKLDSKVKTEELIKLDIDKRVISRKPSEEGTIMTDPVPLNRQNQISANIAQEIFSKQGDGTISQKEFISSNTFVPPTKKKFKDEFPLFVEDISTPFVETAQLGKEFFFSFSQDPKKTGEQFSELTGKISKKGEEAQKFLGGKSKAVRDFLTPPKTEAEERLDRRIERLDLSKETFSSDIGKLNKDIESFNTEFGSTELTKNQFETALAQEIDINKRVNTLETTRLKLESQEKLVDILKDEQRRKKESDPSTFITSFGQGFATAPIELASFGVGIATNPKKTAKETVTGLASLPETIVLNPFSTTGTIAGAVVADSIIFGAIASGLSKATAVQKTIKIKTKVSQTSSIDKAVQVGIDPVTGNKIYTVTGKIKTAIINAKTGKTIRVIDTQTVTNSVISKTKEGAIQASSRTIGSSLKKGGLRFTKDAKVTQVFDITESKATLTLKKDGKAFTGTAKGEVGDFGTLRFKGDFLSKDIFGDFSKTGKFTKTRLPLKSETLSNINVKTLASKKVDTIIINTASGKGKGFKFDVVNPKIKLTTKETIALNKVLTDITPKNLKVSGFTRGTKSSTFFVGGKMVTVKTPIKIKAITRKFPGRVKGGKPRKELFSRDLTKGITKTVEPQSIKIIDSVKIKKPPKPKKPMKPFTQDISSSSKGLETISKKVTLTKGQTAKVAGKVGQSQIKADIARKIPKTQQRTFLVQKDFTKISTPTGVGSGILSSVRQRQRTRQDEDTNIAGKSKLGLGVTDLSFVNLADDQAFRFDQAFRIEQVPRSGSRTLTDTDISVPVVVPPSPNGRTRPRPRPEPGTPKRPVLLLGLDSKEDKATRKTSKKKQAYDVFIKKRKIADNLPKNRAKDFGAYVTDNTIAGQFRIRKSKGKTKPTPIKTPRNYFKINRRKFRSFEVRKGRRVMRKNKFIEKQRVRLDTRGEVKQITASRFIANRRTPKPIKNFNFSNSIRKII